MPLSKAIFIFILLACGIALVVGVLLRGWSAQSLPFWSKLIWGLIGAIILIPRFLPASIRWDESVSLAQVIVGAVVAVLSIKCMILMLRHSSALSAAERAAAWLGIVPLIIGAIMVLFFFWMAGALGGKK